MVLPGLLWLWLSLPPTMIWAWERPEDLSFVDPARIGVAYLAATVRLADGDGVETLPRLQPLVVPERATVLPVVRLESPLDRDPTLSTDQRRAVVDAIDAVVPLDGARAFQIDFDARLSERAFYRALLEDLRSAMPEGSFLSITALTSWCLGDPWLEGLPVDEAVPMLFRMGDHAASIRKKLRAGDDFVSSLCRTSAGVSTDEPVASLPRGRRYYLFHPRIWSPSALERVLLLIKESQR